MTNPSSPPEHPIWRHAGTTTLSAAESILKGALECLPSVQRVVYVASQATGDLDDIQSNPDLSELLRMHRLRVDRMADAGRAAQMAAWAARQGQHVVAVLTGPTVPAALSLLESTSRPLPEGAALGLIVEDLALNSSAVDIRGRLSRKGIPVLEARDVPHLRDSIENVLRISRSDRGMAAVVVDRSVLRNTESVTLRANRGEEDIDDPMRHRRRRRPRWQETGGPLRMARRLELNSWRALPSPGEAISIGFITVGPADRALRHMAMILGISGKLPALHLGVIHPMDDAAVARILQRCRNVVVLEPRPGTVERDVLRVAEQLRRRGEESALVWGEALPPDEDGQTDGFELREALHPSSLLRKLQHLLRDFTTSDIIKEEFQEEPPALPVPVLVERFGAAGQHEAVRRLAATLIDAIDQNPSDSDDHEEADRDPSQELSPVRLFLDGVAIGPVEGRPVYVETFSGPSFFRHGAAAVRQAALSKDSWILMVAQPHGSSRVDLERLARAAVPADHAAQIHIKRGTLAETSRLRRMLRESLHESGLVVIIIDDGPPTRFDVNAIEAEMLKVDQQGFQPMQRIVWPADRASVIRQPPMLAELEVEAVRHAAALETRTSRESLPWRWPPRLGGRVKLLVEQVEVHRSRPPIRELLDVDKKIKPPTPIHADAASWSVHIAGLRGKSPGLAARVLLMAGTRMGYHVQARMLPAPTGAGRRAWAQVSFCRPRTDEEAAAIGATIPWGEADLLLSLDRAQGLLSVSPDGSLRVAAAGRTRGVINIGLFEDQMDKELASQSTAEIAAYFRELLHPEGQVIEDYTDLCRWRFHNERLADLAQLGTAFQMGAVPLSGDSIEGAIQELEASGYARSMEAFTLGRYFAEHSKGLRRPGEDPNAETAERFIRRQRTPSLGKHRMGTRGRSERFARLTQRVYYDIPDLDSTEEGREAYCDLAVALRRCVTWGGFDYAERFADAIVSLYNADRSDRGRALTRKAILPLAEAYLARDSIYLASMAVSSEHRRHTRQRLNVHLARGDVVEVRYLTRLELTLARWRFRVDLRTSDWLARILAAARHVLPTSWRATRRDRLVRRLVQEILLRAATGAQDDYERWLKAMQELHDMALDGRLRRINPQRLRDLLRQGADDLV